MDINVTVKIESPEIMASILALAESLTQMRLVVKHLCEGENNKIQGEILDGEGEKEPLLARREANDIIKSEGEEKRQDNKTITLEEVRAKLAALSQEGKQLQIKELLKKYGVTKLTAVNPQYYERLLSAAEQL